MTGEGARQPQLTLADIAVLANVGRPAVSNWRKRFADFPQPVAGTAASPLFDPLQVEEWLRQTDRYVGRPGVEHRLWKAMDRFRGELPMETVLEAVCAVATLRYVTGLPQRARNLAEGAAPAPEMWASVETSPPHRQLDDLRHAAVRVEAATPSLTGLLAPPLDRLPERAADLLQLVGEIPVEDTARLVEAVIGMLRRATGRGGLEWTTAEPLSELVVNLARPVNGTVYDPAAGVAGALLEARREAEGPVQLTGQEVNESAWRLANLRLIVHGADGSVSRGNTLLHDREPGLRASLIVLDPPFALSNWGADEVRHDRRWRFGEPTGKSADMAWVQHAVAHLAPGGRAFVLLPAGSLSRGGGDGRIRHELIRQGAVEAVVALPGGLVPRTGIALALWVLTRPEESPARDRVLLIDATAFERASFSSRAPDVVDLYHRWRRTGELGEADWAVAPNLLDLLGIEATLLPSRWIPTALESADAEQVIGELRRDAGRLSSALRALGASPDVRLDVQAATDHATRRMSVERLVTDGELTLYRGERVPRDELDAAGEVPVITASHVRQGAVPDPADCLGVPADVLQGRVERTQAGDVLVLPEGGPIRAVVVEKGGAIAAWPLWVLRPRPNSIHPGYLAACLASEWNNRHLMGNAIPRAHVRDLEVPLLPPDAQQSVVGQLQQLDALRRDSELAAILAGRMSQRVVDGLAAGVLTVDESD
ncbi:MULTISPECIES: N-6 DNA methylase [unclassified Modestobacter]